jgi:hypothetical protein
MVVRMAVATDQRGWLGGRATADKKVSHRPVEAAHLPEMWEHCLENTFRWRNFCLSRKMLYILEVPIVAHVA